MTMQTSTVKTALACNLNLFLSNIKYYLEDWEI